MRLRSRRAAACSLALDVQAESVGINTAPAPTRSSTFLRVIIRALLCKLRSAHDRYPSNVRLSASEHNEVPRLSVFAMFGDSSQRPAGVHGRRSHGGRSDVLRRQIARIQQRTGLAALGNPDWVRAPDKNPAPSSVPHQSTADATLTLISRTPDGGGRFACLAKAQGFYRNLLSEF